MNRPTLLFIRLTALPNVHRTNHTQRSVLPKLESSPSVITLLSHCCIHAFIVVAIFHLYRYYPTGAPEVEIIDKEALQICRCNYFDVVILRDRKKVCD